MDLDVNCLAYFTTLSTVCSIIQQTRLVLYWEDIMTARFDYAATNVASPEAVISNAAIGEDLVLYYIRKSFHPNHVGLPLT